MDGDLGEMIGRFLSEPDSMEKLQGMLKTLGTESPPAPSVPFSPSPNDNAFLQSLMPLLSGVGNKGESDRNVALLRALRPFLQNGREKRVDEAIDMMQLFKLLPLLTGKGQGGGERGV